MQGASYRRLRTRPRRVERDWPRSGPRVRSTWGWLANPPAFNPGSDDAVPQRRGVRNEVLSHAEGGWPGRRRRL